jgi:protein-disulfide isomerase
MKASVINTITNGVLAACAVTITVILLRRELFPPKPAAANIVTTRQVPNWKDYRTGQPLGAPNRSVSLVVFSDYECPACRRLFWQLDTLRAKFPTQLSVYYRNVPIAYHRKARPAALAAECAAVQGRFETAHRLLFIQGDSIGIRPWGRFAAAAGITDTARFSDCVRDSLTVAQLVRDEQAANTLGLRATPTFLLDSILMQGAPRIETLEAMIKGQIR